MVQPGYFPPPQQYGYPPPPNGFQPQHIQQQPIPVQPHVEVEVFDDRAPRDLRIKGIFRKIIFLVGAAALTVIVFTKSPLLAFAVATGSVYIFAGRGRRIKGNRHHHPHSHKRHHHISYSWRSWIPNFANFFVGHSPTRVYHQQPLYQEGHATAPVPVDFSRGGGPNPPRGNGIMSAPTHR